ncbi:MAG: TetR/AcrR family transcriptional regulator [Alphaproteobacteria bacterium]|nr:TetR/AcrR family transcriptional regulator [Alphaproteobacteria bacterium]
MSVGIGRREQAKAERRLRIIGAARNLIRETGDTNLSMRTIAKRAQVSLATPYNLFGSKRAVVLAVLEDVRDFTERFGALHPVNSIERIFQALSLAMDYYVKDPDFYRTLWKALLDTSGKEDSEISTPQSRAQNRAFWQSLIEDAQKDGFLEADIRADMFERNMSYTFNGVMLAWVMGGIESEDMVAAAGLGYALKLQGAATASGRERLAKKVSAYQKMLAKAYKRTAE